jgi:hypothetical protein
MEDTRLDWTGTPLHEFAFRTIFVENRSVRTEHYPHGDGEAQRIMYHLWYSIDDAYTKFLPYETDKYGMTISGDDFMHWERTGEVPIIREGRREKIELESITLADVPAIFDTLKVLEQEHNEREREERERKKAERRTRERVRAKERRKLKKLGEW